MTSQQYVIQRKLSILELGQTLGNVSEACRRLGVSRQHHYDIKAEIEEYGIEGLIEKARSKPRIGNRVGQEVEEKILAYGLEYPTHGQVRVSNELRKQFGIIVSAGGVRGVWIRHGLKTKADRLKRLEKWASETQGVLTESQVVALESAKEEKEAHGEIETHHPGFLLGQDTDYVGYIKGVGKIYQQTAIDTYSNVGFAKIYSDKTALTSADLLNDKVLPFFDGQGIPLLRVLTDRGSEYGHRNIEHPFQLYLQMNGIEHSRSKARHPQTNGCTERLNQIIGEEFYQTAFRKKRYATLDEIQSDLDLYMRHYNEERTNQGKRCQGRTPMETFIDGLRVADQFLLGRSEETEVLETVTASG